jgi:hypothetical protein
MYQSAIRDKSNFDLALQPVYKNNNDGDIDTIFDNNQSPEYYYQSDYPTVYNYFPHQHSELDHYNLPPIMTYPTPLPIQYHLPQNNRSKSQVSHRSHHRHHRHHHHHHHRHNHHENYYHDSNINDNSRPSSPNENENEKISIEINVADHLKNGKDGKKSKTKIQKTITYPSSSYAKRNENELNSKRWISDTKLRTNPYEMLLKKSPISKFKSKHICSLCPHTDDINHSFDNIYVSNTPRKYLTPIVKVKKPGDQKPKIEVRTTQRKNRNIFLSRDYQPEIEDEDEEVKEDKKETVQKIELPKKKNVVPPIALQYNKPVPVILKPVQTQNSDQQVYYLEPTNDQNSSQSEEQIQTNNNLKKIVFVQQDQPSLVALQQPLDQNYSYSVIQNHTPRHGINQLNNSKLARHERRESIESEISDKKPRPYVHHFVDNT